MQISQNTTNKREKIIFIATKLFIKKGFNATSIDDIIKLCGGSKRDIYNQFQSKTGLFDAVFLNITQKFQKSLKFDSLDVKNPQESLENFALRLIRLYTKEQNLSFYKMIFQEQKTFPQIPKKYYENIQIPIKQNLVNFFLVCQNNDVMKDYEAIKLAEIFLAIIKDKVHSQILYATKPNLSKISSDINQNIEIFLNGALK